MAGAVSAQLPEPVTTAGALVAERFPDARAAFVAGSVLTARRTPTSDLDILVLVGSEAPRFRESFRHAGWPVELFVQSEEDWRGFADDETAARRSPLLHMTADGRLLVDADRLGARLQAEARQRLAAGPPPVPAPQLAAKRYALTDGLDDLHGCPDPLERIFLAAHLLEQAAELVLLADGHWLGLGKWLSRRLADADPGLHGRLTAGAAAVASGAPDGTDRLAAAVTEALNRAGGPLWEGYRLGAPGTGPRAAQSADPRGNGPRTGLGWCPRGVDLEVVGDALVDRLGLRRGHPDGAVAPGGLPPRRDRALAADPDPQHVQPDERLPPPLL